MENNKKQNEETKPQTEVTAEKTLAVTPRKSNGLILALAGLVIIIVLLFSGFFFFHFTNRSFMGMRNRFAINRTFNQGNFRGSMGHGRFMGANSVSGKVTSVNNLSFTIDQNGTTKTVQISSTTRFPINSATKVVVGDQVVIRGGQDNQGVIQATLIIVNPTYPSTQ